MAPLACMHPTSQQQIVIIWSGQEQHWVSSSLAWTHEKSTLIKEKRKNSFKEGLSLPEMVFYQRFYCKHPPSYKYYTLQSLEKGTPRRFFNNFFLSALKSLFMRVPSTQTEEEMSWYTNGQSLMRKSFSTGVTVSSSCLLSSQPFTILVGHFRGVGWSAKDTVLLSQSLTLCKCFTYTLF